MEHARGYNMLVWAGHVNKNYYTTKSNKRTKETKIDNNN